MCFLRHMFYLGFLQDVEVATMRDIRADSDKGHRHEHFDLQQ